MTDPTLDPLTPIPLTILTGFLGAGKTTRLNRWLADPAFADTLVIINEFGAIGLDHLFTETVEGDMVLMAAGCLCCTIRGDLVATLEDLLRRRDNSRIRLFRRVIIETTGLADPLPILQAVLQHPYLNKRFRIASLVTIVDAVHGAETLASHAEARRQAVLADALILSKADIATPEQITETRRAIAALQPQALWLADDAATSPAALTALRFSPNTLEDESLLQWLDANTGISHQPGHDPNRHGDDIDAFSFVSNAIISEGQLAVFREAIRVMLGPKLLRMKGIVAVRETPDQPLVIHQVQSISEAPVRLPRWPGRDRRTRIVLITQGAQRAMVEGFWTALTNAASG
jgi:G3E family GTPase